MIENEKPRVLLTANCMPCAPMLGEDPYNLMSSRWMRKHGAFQLDMYGHYFGLYLIAENLSVPTTVLENPTWEDFDRELDTGYDVIGFQLKSHFTASVARMIRRIREKSTQTRIVIGGYGVAALGNPVPGDIDGDAAYILKQADHLCRGEGVAFMRKLLNDGPLDREITQYHLPTFAIDRVTGLPGVHLRIPTILVSLGCPSACDFCNTSAMFKQRKIRVAEPEQVYRYMKHYQARLSSREITCMLWDEDFFLDPEYVRELGRLLRSTRETWGARYYTFGSIRALSAFDPEEIRDCGCQMVWVGVESFQGEIGAYTESGTTDKLYHKRGGKDAKTVVSELHKNGVQVTGSLVLGLDLHTRENCKDDIDRFVDLKPMFYQVSHLLPCPGTVLYQRLKTEGRILDSYKWDDVHFWSTNHFEYLNMTREDAEELFEYAHDQLRDVNGPPQLQMLESMLDCAVQLEGKTSEYHQYLARRSRLFASALYAFIESIRQHHPSPVVRERAEMLDARYCTEIGEPTEITRAASVFIAEQIAERSSQPNTPSPPCPPVRWTCYNTSPDEVMVRKGSADAPLEPYRDGGAVTGKGLMNIIRRINREVDSFQLLPQQSAPTSESAAATK